MSLVDTIGRLETILTNLTKDLEKVNRGNRAAAQRVRVGTIHLEKVGKQFRKESIHSEKGGKKKSSLKKAVKKAKKRKR